MRSNNSPRGSSRDSAVRANSAPRRVSAEHYARYANEIRQLADAEPHTTYRQGLSDLVEEYEELACRSGAGAASV